MSQQAVSQLNEMTPNPLDNPGWLYLYGEYDFQACWYHNFQQDVSKDNISMLQSSQSRVQKLRCLLSQIVLQ